MIQERPQPTAAERQREKRPASLARLGQARLVRGYREALKRYVAQGDEGDLMTAYDLARSALASNVPLSAFPHAHALAVAAIPAATWQSESGRGRAETFMVEFLSVYDMALRGYQSTVPQLRGEIAKRKQIEASLRDRTAELKAERDTLDAQVLARTQELRAQAEALATTLAHLRQTNSEQAEFTYAISHDLKSPSNTIGMLIDELQHGHAAQLDDDGRDLLDQMRLTVRRMSRLVDDVLAYSRCLDSHDQAVRVDVNETIEEILADLRFDILRSDAVVAITRLNPVLGDPMQVKLLFQNMISNALKFHAPDARPQVAITQRLSGPNKVLISVRDNGIGIAPEHFQRIFGLFQRLHSQSTFGGSGIGLALCKRIASNLGGDIRLTSTEGVGSKFTVKLNRYLE